MSAIRIPKFDMININVFSVVLDLIGSLSFLTNFYNDLCVS